MREKEIARQYQENQGILDCRAVLRLLNPDDRFLQSNHPMHGYLVLYHSELLIPSLWLMLSAIAHPFRKKENGEMWLPVELLCIINSFLITTTNPHENIMERFENLGNALFRPGIAKPQQSYLFQPGIADVIDAIVCGNFNKSKRLLEANLHLLTQYGTAITPSDVVLENVTPLQAAILSSDTNVFIMIRDLFFSQNNAAEFERQRLEIYTRRLTTFRDQAQREGERLHALFDAGITHDPKFERFPIGQETFVEFRELCDYYQQALDSQHFQTIFEAHQEAERNDAFYLVTPIAKAFKQATEYEVMNALFDKTRNSRWCNGNKLRIMRRMMVDSIESKLPTRTAHTARDFNDAIRNSREIREICEVYSFVAMRIKFSELIAKNEEIFSAMIAPPECAAAIEPSGPRKRPRAE